MSERIASALLVDDNSLTCEATRLRLEGDGYSVAVARSSSEGLAHAKSAAPNVIFLHLGPRDKGGNIAFIQALRADDSCRHIRVVVLTGRPSLPTGQKGLRPVNRDLW
ncbi:MAG TPA: response regulator [Candidatus Udaeobacter sp.]|nr:response regulator [Candidatus Udaeobacter sp.]